MKPDRKIRLVMDCLFLALENTRKLKKGNTYLISGWGKGLPVVENDSESREEFWVICNFYNAEESFVIWKKDINRFFENGILEDKGMIK